MPEFILDMGSPEAAITYNQLDDFTRGYVEAMFFTSTGTGDDEDLEHASFAELSQETLRLIICICTRFQITFRDDLDEALDTGRINGYDEQAAGRDLWYTSNGHGVGYWDRGLGEIGDTLTKHAHTVLSRDLYRGDDGLLYLG